MKKFALAAAISLVASAAFAGSPAEPVVEPIIETVEPGSSASSAGNIWLPILALVLIGAAVAASD